MCGLKAMADIIKFPLGAQKARGRGNRPNVSALSSINGQLYLGPWEFTCQKCGAKTKFESTNMVFRTVEFYCASCGTLHRVTNPAFSPAPKK